MLNLGSHYKRHLRRKLLKEFLGFFRRLVTFTNRQPPFVLMHYFMADITWYHTRRKWLILKLPSYLNWVPEYRNVTIETNVCVQLWHTLTSVSGFIHNIHRHVIVTYDIGYKLYVCRRTDKIIKLTSDTLDGSNDILSLNAYESKNIKIIKQNNLECLVVPASRYGVELASTAPVWIRLENVLTLQQTDELKYLFDSLCIIFEKSPRGTKHKQRGWEAKNPTPT